jgi:hypothetical protein
MQPTGRQLAYLRDLALEIQPDVSSNPTAWTSLPTWADDSIFTAEPGSRSEQALALVGSRAATIDRAEPARMTDQG